MHLNPIAAQAQLDLAIAYDDDAGLTGASIPPGDISGLTFTPGLYKTSSTVMLSGGNANSPVLLCKEIYSNTSVSARKCPA
jgi:Ice-binding-like